MWSFNMFSGKKKEEAHVEPRLHDTESLRKILISKKKTSIEKSFIELALSKYNEIHIIVNEMEQKLVVFDNSNLGEDEMDPRLFQVLLGNKKTLSKKLHEIFDILKIPVEKDKNSLTNYFNNSYSTLTDVISSSITNYKKIEYHFDKLIDPIVKGVNSIVAIIESFKNEIKTFQSKIMEIDSIEDTINEFALSLVNKSKLQNEKLNADEKLRELEKEKSSLAIKLDNIINSDAYRSYSKLINEREEMERKIEENKSAFINSIAPLDKPMKKFLKLVEDDGLDFENQKSLEKFIENHDLTEENLSLIKDASIRMNSVIHKLKLNDDTVKKVVRKIEEIITDNILDGIYQQKLTLVESLKSIENQITSSTPHEKIELEKNIDRLESSMNSIENESMTIEKDVSVMENNIVQCQQKLKSMFKEVLNEDVNIYTN